MGTYSGYSGVVLGDTSAFPSTSLWHQVDADANRPGRWLDVFKDFGTTGFVTPTTEATWAGDMKAFTSSGGTLAGQDIEGGVIAVHDATDNEAASIGMANFPFKIIRGGGDLVLEARYRTDLITDTGTAVFIGLIETAALSVTVPLGAAAGAHTDNNYVGFDRLEGDGDQFDTVYKANGVTAVTVKADAITLVAATWVKLGMVYCDAESRLYFYKDGVVLPDSKEIPAAAGTDFPNDVRLGFVMAVMGAASGPIVSLIDWFRVAQRRVLQVQ